MTRAASTSAPGGTQTFAECRSSWLTELAIAEASSSAHQPAYSGVIASSCSASAAVSPPASTGRAGQAGDEVGQLAGEHRRVLAGHAGGEDLLLVAGQRRAAPRRSASAGAPSAATPAPRARCSRSVGPASRSRDQPRSSSTASTSGTRSGTRPASTCVSRGSCRVPGPLTLNQTPPRGGLEADRARPGPGVRLLPLPRQALARSRLGQASFCHPGAGLGDGRTARSTGRRA